MKELEFATISEGARLVDPCGREAVVLEAKNGSLLLRVTNQIGEVYETVLSRPYLTSSRWEVVKSDV